MFARELADGTVSKTQLQSAMFVLSPSFKEHDVLPGLLAATLRQSEDRVLLRHRKVDMDIIQRASWYLVNVMHASVSSLRALNLSMGRQLQSHKMLPPTWLQPKDGSRVYLPLSYNSICFPGVAL